MIRRRAGRNPSPETLTDTKIAHAQSQVIESRSIFAPGMSARSEILPDRPAGLNNPSDSRQVHVWEGRPKKKSGDLCTNSDPSQERSTYSQKQKQTIPSKGESFPGGIPARSAIPGKKRRREREDLTAGPATVGEGERKRERRLMKGRGEDRNQGPRREIPASRTKGTMCAQGAKESFGTMRSGEAPGAQEGSVSREVVSPSPSGGRPGVERRDEERGGGSISPFQLRTVLTQSGRPPVRLAVLPPAPIQGNSNLAPKRAGGQAIP